MSVNNNVVSHHQPVVDGSGVIHRTHRTLIPGGAAAAVASSTATGCGGRNDKGGGGGNSDGIYDSDSRRGGPTRIGIMLPHRYWCISAQPQFGNQMPSSANLNGLIDIDVKAVLLEVLLKPGSLYSFGGYS